MMRLFSFLFVLMWLAGCSVPRSSEKETVTQGQGSGIYTSENALFQDCMWSGSTGNGYLFYLEKKDSGIELRVWINGSFTDYTAVPGSTSLQENTWKGEFQGINGDTNRCEAVMIISSETRATATFKIPTGTFSGIQMGKTKR